MDEELKIYLDGKFAELRTEAEATETRLRHYIDERTRDLQTEVLRAFGDYSQAQTTRFRHMKADLGNLNVASDERLAALEDRVHTIEKRLLGQAP